MRAVLAILLATALASPARAEIYRWVDEQGRVNFDDDLARVPESQRESMKVFQSKVPARPAPEANNDGPKQAALARALARDLGLQRHDSQDPVSVLQVVGIYPAVGWHPDAPLTPSVVDEVAHATVAAARGHRLSQSPMSAEAAVLRVAEALGVDAPPPTILEPPPPPAPEPAPIVLAPNIIVEAPAPVVVQQSTLPGPYLGSVDPAYAYGVPYRSFRRGPSSQPPVARIPPLSHPTGSLRPPVIQPFEVRPFARPVRR